MKKAKEDDEENSSGKPTIYFKNLFKQNENRKKGKKDIWRKSIESDMQ